MTDLEACKQLLARLWRGEAIASRELERALGEEHWAEYQWRRQWTKESRVQAKIARYELRRYAEMLRIADLCDAQPTRSTGRWRRRKGRRPPTSPSRKYERALEHLSERIQENWSLERHLDRPFRPYCWDCSTDIGPAKESVPRLWFHREHALPGFAQWEIKTIKLLKLEALKRAIEALSTPPAVSIKRKLNRLRLPKLRKSG